METNQKFNYLPLVQAMEQLVKRAMSLNIKKQDPHGNLTSHQISGIRIAYLQKESYGISYDNGIKTPMLNNKTDPELLLTLFFANEKKEVNFPIPIQARLLAQPEGLLSLVWTKLSLAIDELIDEFYASKIEDNKFYQEQQVEVVHLEDAAFQLNPLASLPNMVCDQMLHLVRDCYLVKHVAFVDAGLSSKRELWIVVDSCGTRIIDFRDTAEFSITPYFLGRIKRLYQSTVSGIFRDFESLLLSIRNELGQKLQKILSTADRKQLESGIYPLLLAPSAVGTLFHEALGAHMLSGAYIVDEVSTVFKGKLGKQITKEGFMEVLNHIQLWDCPRDQDMIASYQYDMEGAEAHDVCLIDKGKIKNYLLDRNSAARFKLQNNGHALAGSFNKQVLVNYFLLPEAVLPEPRVSNLKIISDSDYSLEEMKADMLDQFGYYLWVESGSGEVNVETGTFELKVDVLVKEYQNGKKEYFHGGVLSANLTDFLSSIFAVSNYYGKTQGYCGAQSGWVPTEECAPAMSAYGINWIPDPLPEKNKILNLKRDKYIPKDWEQKTSSFDLWMKWDVWSVVWISYDTPFLFRKSEGLCQIFLVWQKSRNCYLKSDLFFS